MAIEYDIDETKRLVRSRAYGVVSPDELLAHIRRLAEDDAVPQPLHELWDGSEVESFSAQGADVRRFVATATALNAHRGPVRLAIVAPGALLFGLGRMTQLLADSSPFEVGVFRQLAPAVEWMDARLAERDDPRLTGRGSIT